MTLEWLIVHAIKQSQSKEKSIGKSEAKIGQQTNDVEGCEHILCYHCQDKREGLTYY